MTLNVTIIFLIRLKLKVSLFYCINEKLKGHKLKIKLAFFTNFIIK